MKKFIYALVPLIVLTYFFIHNILEFHDVIAWESAVPVILRYSLLVLLLALMFPFYRNDKKNTALFATLLFFFLLYGDLIDNFAKWFLHKKYLSQNLSFQAITYCFFNLFLAATIYRLNEKRIVRILNFWVTYCVLLIVYETGHFFLSPGQEQNTFKEQKGFVIKDSREKPHIFFLLFDMYPSDQVLETNFLFKNRTLDSFLAKKDFYISHNAHSLYDVTVNSISSTLNFDEREAAKSSGNSFRDACTALKRIENAVLLKSLVKSGYVINNYSLFDLNESVSPLSFNLSLHQADILTHNTFFNRIYDQVETDMLIANGKPDIRFLKSSWSGQIKSDISFLRTNLELLLDKMVMEKQPSFNYFHFMIPHDPAVFDSVGNLNDFREMYSHADFEKSKSHFISYLNFGNRQLFYLISRIIEKTNGKSVIILQGDHGYRYGAGKLPLSARYGILNAVYLPNRNYRGFNDTLTPVKTYKLIFRNQLGLDIDSATRTER